MTILQKALHSFVVGAFVLAGAVLILGALRSGLRLGLPRDLYFRSETDFLFGVVFLLAAFGVYRFDRRVHSFAIVLAAFMAIACIVAALLAHDFWTLGWLAVWGVVLYGLLLPTVRAKFLPVREATGPLT
jgi:hypothetical protein